jgi:hypothetical protein
MIGLASRRRADLALVAAWARAVFRDGELLGTAHPLDGGRWLAEAADGRAMGTFPSERLAVQAVLNAGRR